MLDLSATQHKMDTLLILITCYAGELGGFVDWVGGLIVKKGWVLYEVSNLLTRTP